MKTTCVFVITLLCLGCQRVAGTGVVGKRELRRMELVHRNALARRNAVRADTAFIDGRGGHVYTFSDGEVIFVEAP